MLESIKVTGNLYFLLFSVPVVRSSPAAQINNIARPKCSTVLIVVMVTFLNTTAEELFRW